MSLPPIAPTPVDLLLAYDWPYDEPFIALLYEAFHGVNLRLMTVSTDALPEALGALGHGDYRVRTFLDRAFDTTPAFGPLVEWAAAHVPVHLNPLHRQQHVWRKTNVLWDFIQAGVHTPYTLALPSLTAHPVIAAPPDLERLGRPFCIKPDVGGGGWGVHLDAQGWPDVEAARRATPQDDLILQELVTPVDLDGRRAWFRLLCAGGHVVPCWWDDTTHLYGEAVTDTEREAFGLAPLWDIAHAAARIAGIQLFSTEVALVADGRFVVVDYVNDPLDLRFRPHAREGMPRSVAVAIAAAIARYVQGTT